MGQLSHAYPDFFTPHRGTREFVLTLNDIIHPEVRKLYPGADVPEFDFDASKPDRLVMGYVSKRKLCPLAEGLLLGAGEYYQETIGLNHSQCLRRGDKRCEWTVTLTARG